MNHFKSTKTNKKKRYKPSPFLAPSKNFTKTTLTQISSFKNIQTFRICSLEICLFETSPSGNYFCQMLKEETRQILTKFCSLLVLKSKAFFSWSCLLEQWRMSDFQGSPRIITDISHLRISRAFP